MTYAAVPSRGFSNSLPWFGYAVSEAAEVLRARRSELLQKRNAAASVSAPLYAAFERLEVITSEFRDEVDVTIEVDDHMKNSEALAKKFLEFLPPKFQDPEFAVEDDGSVAMEWRPERGRVLVVSFVSTGRIEYAGLDGITNRFHGPAIFIDRIPAKVIEHLEQLRLN